MEKIYMENNNNNKKQSKFMQIMNSKLSNTLSITMILVAFASFLAMGFSGNVSYALVTTDNVPNSFTIKSIDVNNDMLVSYKDSTPIQDNGKSVYVDRMITSTNSQVFCLDSDEEFPTEVGITYNKFGAMKDSGVTYILRNSYPETTSLITGFSGNGNQDVGTWVTQVATWNYLVDTNSEYKNTKFERFLPYFKQANNISTIALGVNGYKNTNFYSSYVSQLVNNAKKYSGKVNKPTVTKKSDDISVSDDGKYYQTALISVDTASNLMFTDGNEYAVDASGNITTSAPYKDKSEGFHLELPDNAPKGLQIIGEDGKEISKDVYESHMPITQFYVRVPVSSLTNDNKNLSVNIVGDYMENQSIVYTPSNSNYQSVVLLAYAPAQHNFDLSIDLTYTPNVPDTGMTSAQSIYFIGLVILICGVGIIYANTKQKQEQ